MARRKTVTDIEEARIDAARKSIERARTPGAKAQRLLDYARLVYLSDTTSALAAATEAYALAEQNHLSDIMIDAKSLEGTARRWLNHIDEAMSAFESACALAEKHGRRAKFVICLSRRAEAAFAGGKIDLAVELGEESRQLSATLDDLSATAHVHYTLGAIYHARADFVRSVEDYSIALEARIRQGIQREIVACRSALCSSYIRLGRFAEAITEARQAIEVAKTLNDKLIHANALNAYGFAVLDLGDLQSALDAFLEGYSISEKMGESLHQINMLNNIAVVYTRMKDYETALRYQEQALALSRKFNVKRLIASNLSNISYLYGQAEQFDKTLQFAGEAFAIAQEVGQQYTAASALSFIAWVYYNQKKYSLAYKTFSGTLKLYRTMKDNSRVSETLRQLGEIEIARKHFDKALSFLIQSLSIAEEIKVINHQFETHLLIAHAYELRAQRGDAGKALHHLREVLRLKELFYNEQKQRAMVEMQVRHDTLTALREREEMRAQVESKSKELAALAIQLAEKNELVKTLSTKIRSAVREVNARESNALASLSHELEVQTVTGSTWQSFEQQFALVHTEFLGRLAQNHRTLTSTELKVCALLKLQLSTKQIASFLQVSPRAIDKHRNQIRKKLALPLNVNLPVYFSVQ